MPHRSSVLHYDIHLLVGGNFDPIDVFFDGTDLSNDALNSIPMSSITVTGVTASPATPNGKFLFIGDGALKIDLYGAEFSLAGAKEAATLLVDFPDGPFRLGTYAIIPLGEVEAHSTRSSVCGAPAKGSEVRIAEGMVRISDRSRKTTIPDK